MYAANETIVFEHSARRGREPIPHGDRTADLARIIRHALKAGAASPLDRAIRSALLTDGMSSDANLESRTDCMARQLNAALAERGAAHRETVRG